MLWGITDNDILRWSEMQAKVYKDTGHCSWLTSKLLCLMCVTGPQRTPTSGVKLAEGSEQQHLPQLSVCFWGLHPRFCLCWRPYPRSRPRDPAPCQLLLPPHCNDNSYHLSSISCVFSNVLRTAPESAFNPHNHHTGTEKTDRAVTKFPLHHGPY